MMKNATMNSRQKHSFHRHPECRFFNKIFKNNFIFKQRRMERLPRTTVYLNDESLYTLQLGLQVFKEQSSTRWNYLMAGSLLVLMPVIILFFFFQKYFIQGSNILGQTDEK